MFVIWLESREESCTVYNLYIKTAQRKTEMVAFIDRRNYIHTALNGFKSIVAFIER